jgi:RIO kinase 1
VEHDHPNALEFLRKDLLNVTEFFRKKGVSVLTTRVLFDFVVNPNITDAEATLTQLSENRAMQGEDEQPVDSVDERVFQQIYIPRKLDEVCIYIAEAANSHVLR